MKKDRQDGMRMNKGNRRVCRGKVRYRGRGKALIARMRGRGSVKMTTDEILALTRGDR